MATKQPPELTEDQSVPDKRPVGRPRTTVDDLPDNWREVMEDCGERGASAVEARLLLNLGESAWATLLKDSEEFQRTEKRRQDLCEQWWETKGREMTSGAQGNATVWIFNMKNRFGWRDKHEHDITSSDGSMTPKAIDATKLSTEALQELLNAKNTDD